MNFEIVSDLDGHLLYPALLDVYRSPSLDSVEKWLSTQFWFIAHCNKVATLVN